MKLVLAVSPVAERQRGTGSARNKEDVGGLSARGGSILSDDVKGGRDKSESLYRLVLAANRTPYPSSLRRLAVLIIDGHAGFYPYPTGV
jgi:hypothetical protein